MSDETMIIDELDAETQRVVVVMASDRGVSVKELVGGMIRQAVAEEAELLAKIEEGRRQIAAGDYVTHEELVAQIRNWRQEQRRAA